MTPDNSEMRIMAKCFPSVLACSLILAGVFDTARAAEPASKVVGLSPTKPADGRSVKTDHGYMIPYTVKVPGTDVSFHMVPIPGGEFRMGSPASETGRNGDEGPQVRIRVAPFWMAKHEVRWAEFKVFMSLYGVFKEFEAQRIRRVTEDNLVDAITAPTELYEPSFTYQYGEDPDQAAVTMTQISAKHYTKWMTAITGQQYRLPTEAEWEYACRAGSSTAWSFGDDPKKLGEYAWFAGTTDDDGQRKVGLKKPNAWGLYDMHGNVAEWVLDGYEAEGYQAPKGKDPVNSEDAVAWPTKHYPRVVRGGSWQMTAAQCRSAARLGSNASADPDKGWKSEDPNIPLSPWWFTSDPARGVGFRMIRPLKEVPRKEMAKYWEIDHEDIKSDIDGRIEEGRGVLGLADKDLPAAIKAITDE
jgi:sulfatase modifying factor 1